MIDYKAVEGLLRRLAWHYVKKYKPRFDYEEMVNVGWLSCRNMTEIKFAPRRINLEMYRYCKRQLARDKHRREAEAGYIMRDELVVMPSSDTPYMSIAGELVDRARLTHRENLLLEMRFWHDKTYSEIAKELHSTDVNIRTEMELILEKLRHAIKSNKTD